MSPEQWTLAGVATGEEATFPSATYLRKRYKKLQRRIVSRIPSSSSRSKSRASGAVEVSDTQSSPSCSDPSFQAIRALNARSWARSKPDVIHAIIKDLHGNVVGAHPSTTSKSAEEAQGTQHSPASTNRGPQSSSSRINRLVKAIHRRQRIRYSLSPGGENVDIFVSNGGSETGSPRSVTDQIAALPKIFGRIISSRCEITPQSPDSSKSVDRFFCPRTCAGRQDGSPQARSPGATSTVLSDGGVPRARIGSPIITEEQRRELERRICGRIAANACKPPDESSQTVICGENGTDDDDSHATDDVSHQLKPVDPTQLHSISNNGRRVCHTISPIQLDYQRGRGFETPSLGSRGSPFELSSPLNQKSKRWLSRVKQAMHPDNSPLYKSPVATEDEWLSEYSNKESLASEQAGNNQYGREQNIERVSSWLHRVKDALLESKESPSKKIGRAVNVFREGPVRHVEGSAVKNTPSPSKALKDITNLRQPGYLRSNSFAKEKIRRDDFVEKSKTQKKRSVAAIETAALHNKTVESMRTTASSGSDESRSPSTVVKQTGHKEPELHPEVMYSLARLEGRIPPRPSSPFPIRRSTDDTSPYGSDVEFDLPPAGLATPQPLRPDHELLVGNWTFPLQEAVEAGFECFLEPPEDVEES
ncbi:MAG: hypothetical protein LQ337_000582 [Flavoplaca oasis]|nr:MAG: hypothetical protein LQ337_000582 [Flavoplaca oasis]